MSTKASSDASHLDNEAWNRLKAVVASSALNQRVAVQMLLKLVKESRQIGKRLRALVTLGRLARRSAAARAMLLPRFRELVSNISGEKEEAEHRRLLRDALRSWLVRWRKFQWAEKDASSSSALAAQSSASSLVGLAILFLDQMQPVGAPAPRTLSSTSTSSSAASSTSRPSVEPSSGEELASFLHEATERSLSALENATAAKRLIRMLINDDIIDDMASDNEDEEVGESERDSRVPSSTSSSSSQTSKANKRKKSKRKRDLDDMSRFGIAHGNYSLEIEVPDEGQAPVIPSESEENSAMFEGIREHVRLLRRFLLAPSTRSDSSQIKVLIERHEQEEEERMTRVRRRLRRRDRVVAAAAAAVVDASVASARQTGPIFIYNDLLKKAKLEAKRIIDQTQRLGIFVASQRSGSAASLFGNDAGDEFHSEGADDDWEQEQLKAGYEPFEQVMDALDGDGAKIKTREKKDAIESEKAEEDEEDEEEEEEEEEEEVEEAGSEKNLEYVPHFLQENPKPGELKSGETLEEMRKRAPIVEPQPFLFNWGGKVQQAANGSVKIHRFYGESDSSVSIPVDKDPYMSLYSVAWRGGKKK